MIEDVSLDTKYDDFAKRDGATKQQTQPLIGMQWTHPKTRPIAISRVLREHRPTDGPTD